MESKLAPAKATTTITINNYQSNRYYLINLSKLNKNIDSHIISDTPFSNITKNSDSISFNSIIINKTNNKTLFFKDNNNNNININNINNINNSNHNNIEFHNPSESSRQYSSSWGNNHKFSMINSWRAWSARHNNKSQWVRMDLEIVKI